MQKTGHPWENYISWFLKHTAPVANRHVKISYSLNVNVLYFLFHELGDANVLPSIKTLKLERERLLHQDNNANQPQTTSRNTKALTVPGLKIIGLTLNMLCV